MFKLIRIPNSVTGVPEITREILGLSEEIKSGEVYSYGNGLTNDVSSGPYFLALESAGPVDNNQTSVLCFPITSGMEFEVYVKQEYRSSIKPGIRVALERYNDGISACYAEDGEFVVFDTMNMKKDGKIIIKKV